ncbi:hypothetical protein M2132_002053 [Dysgonomonas sp. PH5-45]|nr:MULTISPECIES: hypothetical protein [unclassified Dysgonomonas]MDH6355707.1 hypothetical protein [Dysgonomonas sp. PH5-45]MDH6388604.1 hypothetical protein [Dysgonomonas sp. PH5-37]
MNYLFALLAVFAFIGISVFIWSNFKQKDGDEKDPASDKDSAGKKL